MSRTELPDDVDPFILFLSYLPEIIAYGGYMLYRRVRYGEPIAEQLEQMRTQKTLSGWSK